MKQSLFRFPRAILLCGSIYFITDTLIVRGEPPESPAPAATPSIVQITKVAQDEPVLSPDGKKILFQSDLDGPSNPFVTDLSGRHITRLTQHPGGDDGAVWSHDGKLIAYSSQDHATGISEIYIISADGKNERQITHDHAFDIHPAWSPDGRKLMYTSTKESKNPQYDKADIWQTYTVEGRWSGATPSAGAGSGKHVCILVAGWLEDSTASKGIQRCPRLRDICYE